jgi:hypothetical protein
MSSIRQVACAGALATSLACSFAQAAQRAFVSSTGNDANVANGCPVVAPCRTFQAGHNAVDPGGEILALDGAGFGAVTITKSVSILANPGFYAGISAASGNAVTIATAGVDVRLSGIKLNSLGAANGILMSSGDGLTIENCTFSGFSNAGIEVNAAAKVRVTDSAFTNSNVGLYLRQNAQGDVVNSRFFGNGVGAVAEQFGAPAGSTVTLAVTGSVASRNAYGFLAEVYDPGRTAKMSVSNSTADGNSEAGIEAFNDGGTVLVVVGSTKVTQNAKGLSNLSSTFNSTGNNMVSDNAINASGAITNVGTM